MSAEQVAEASPPTEGVPTEDHETNGASLVRRSGRARRPVTRDRGDEDELATSAATNQPVENGSPQTTRRNPKRKATTAAPSYNIPDNLREVSLAALGTDELKEWLGWVELESEPVSHNSFGSHIRS